MRLIRIQIENINSLAGVHVIDFTDAAYRESGIFSIVGPTGSGKTSILDAVTLALYGMTPRMLEVTSTAKKEDSCMVMTKNARNCSASAVFEAQGRCWRSTWSRRVKRTGRLDNEAVELASLNGPDDREGTVVASQKRLWEAEMRRLLGLDFKAFMRSAMLAQGAFAELLRADVADRARILENITGTAIYGDISLLVHERKGEEERETERLRTELKSAVPMDDEARKALETELARAVSASKAAKVRSDDLHQDLKWATDLGKAREQDTRARNELTQVAEAAKGIEPERERAKAARRAEKPAAKLAERDGAAAEAVRHEGLAKSLGEERVKAEGAVKTAAAEVEAAEKADEAAKRARSEKEPELEAIEAADAAIATQTALKRQADANAALAKGRAGRTALARTRAETAEKTAREAAQRAQETLERLKGDEALPARIGALETEARQCAVLVAAEKAARTKLAADERATKVARKKVEQAKEAAAKALEVLGTAAGRRREAEAAHAIAFAGSTLEQKIGEARRLTSEICTAEWLADTLGLLGVAAGIGSDAVRPLVLRLEARVTDLRNRFEALAAMKAGESQAVIARLSAALDEVVDWSAKAGEAQMKLDRAVADERAAQAASSSAQTAVDRAAAELTLKDGLEAAQREAVEKAAADARGAHEALIAALAPYFAKAPRPGDDTAPLIAELARRAEAWEQTSKAAVAAAGEAEKALTTLEAARTAADEAAKESIARDADAGSAAEKLSGLVAERTGKYGTRSAKAEREALVSAQEQSAKTLRTAETRHAAAGREVTRLATAEAAETRAAAESRAKEAAAREALATLMAEAGFADEEKLLAAVLPKGEAERIEAAIISFERRDAAARQAAKAAAEVLEGLLAKPRRDVKPDVIDAELKAADAELAAADEQKGVLSQRIRTDDELRTRSADAKTRLEAQEKTCALWQRLSSLIGSHDGSRFRRAAQRLTFALLLEQANGILAGMQSRYELITAGEYGLDLAVRDLELAGQERTSFNLSGGETFMVSLALALALSRISTRRMRVDTLFLDEGFGSLDPVTLEKALTALEMLQQTSGKLIGVISHLSSVRERIPVQITVRPKGASGVSEISGPGVRRVEAAA
ncbi:AAA family ATPase [Sutterella sp.]|uniref:AAA family ATPase n=1 Tax=Sutterella sp. TaxID=1981025 RepID=UPI0026E0FF13|nr:AAA family ATPase [Sutterella sp.]MDO5531568.1 AAA family ATPase [Sutterella sp.]